jgi:hypothetical protein
MREYFVGDFDGTYNLDFYVGGFCLAGTSALRAYFLNDIKCGTGRAKIMDFFPRRYSASPSPTMMTRLHRNSFRHCAPLFFDFVLFHLVVKQAAINLQAIGGLRLVARRILQDFAN